MSTQGHNQRAWAKQCGCDGACDSLTFNDDMEIVDVRTRQPKRRKRSASGTQSGVDVRVHDQPAEDEDGGVEAPVLLLHLLLLG
jgi:hypothetical protein